MSQTTVAKRYAVALFEIAKERNILDQIEEEIRVIKEIFSGNKELLSFLNHPKISLDKKRQFLSEIFGTVSVPLKNALMLMVERHRSQSISQMAADFIDLANEEKSIADAKVYTTRPLTEAEREAISSTFARKVGKKTLRIENIIDRNLIGGIKLQIGNRIFDGSISGKLERLERQLLG